jgi:hypothetical protein
VFVTNHALAGAVIGLGVRHTALAAPLAFAAHLAMDRVPHWGDGGDRDRFFRVAQTDGLLALGTLAAIGATAPRGARWHAVTSAAACVAPDFDKPAEHFLGRSPYPTAFDDFHKQLQLGREFPRHLRRELAVGAVLATVYGAAALRRRRASR